MQPIIIISGPAGVGKTTIAKQLQHDYPELETSVTCTTRPPRAEMPEDKKIYYVTPIEFEGMIANEEFLEWAKVHTNYYGTHKAKTLEKLKTHPVIFNIDVQGAKQLMTILPNEKIISFFILPESLEQVRQRIINRGHTDEADVDNRLASAKKELAAQDFYQYKIINHEGQIEKTLAEIKNILSPYLKS